MVNQQPSSTSTSIRRNRSSCFLHLGRTPAGLTYCTALSRRIISLYRQEIMEDARRRPFFQVFQNANFSICRTLVWHTCSFRSYSACYKILSILWHIFWVGNCLLKLACSSQAFASSKLHILDRNCTRS